MLDGQQAEKAPERPVLVDLAAADLQDVIERLDRIEAMLKRAEPLLSLAEGWARLRGLRRA
jgi:hypothetical protein